MLCLISFFVMPNIFATTTAAPIEIGWIPNSEKVSLIGILFAFVLMFFIFSNSGLKIKKSFLF